MQTSSQFLLTLGGILLLGLFVSTLAQRTRLPRVTLLLLFGMAIGREGFDLIPALFTDRFEIIADMTLLMVGFLIGGKLTGKSLKGSAGPALWISLAAALIAALFVGLGLLLVGLSLELAVLLGCIAAATAPAAVLDVVEELRDKSRFSDLLLAIVALDDVWALLLFSLGLAMASSLASPVEHVPFVLMASREIGGAVILGAALGLPAAYLTGRIKRGQPMLTEALGLVFVCGGLALWLEVSYLIAAMVMGSLIANLARHHDYPFHAIEGIEWPFMVIFFVLAGASLQWGELPEIGLIGVVYFLCRGAGKYAGGLLGAWLGGAAPATRRWMGAALLPQAGVAIGMALVASNQFPEYRQQLLSIVIGTTVLFEILGPVFTRLAIIRASGGGHR